MVSQIKSIFASPISAKAREGVRMKQANTLPPAIFIGGAQALDFLNSIATPVDEPVEWIGNGVDFLSWMKQARLLSNEEIEAINQNLSAAQLDVAARDARALRDWFRGFVNAHRGSPLKKGTLDQIGPLNRILGGDAVFWQLELAGTSHEEEKSKSLRPTIFHLRSQRHWRDPGSLLLPLAEEIARFICSTDFRHVKACESVKCTLLFLDQSHRQGRRWCSMSICGNRAKASAFAARAKGRKRK